MSEERPTLSRTARSRATKQSRKEKKQLEKDNTLLNTILNALISIVAILIMISLIIIFTNDKVPNPFSKASSALSEEQQEEQEEATNASNQMESSTETSSESTNYTNTNSTVSSSATSNGQSEAAGSSQEEGTAAESNAETGETQSSEQVSELAYIAKVESSDPNVEVAYVDIRWQSYLTSQKGPHYNHFDREHIDYKEKIANLYAVSGYTEETSILWNIKNQKGDAVAVISSKDKKNIFRVTMTWVSEQGWKTTLIEQLKSLEGAY